MSLSNNQPGDGTWDKFAADYADRLMKNDLIAPLVHALLKDIDEFRPFKSAHGIIDVGCGPGTAINELLDIYGSHIPRCATVAASDNSEGMITQVRALQASHAGVKVWDRLETHIWDLQNLRNVAPGSFSHVLGNLVFMILEEPHQGLAEAHRVLRKDGILGLTSPSMTEWLDVIVAASIIVRPDLVRTQLSLAPWKWSTP